MNFFEVSSLRKSLLSAPKSQRFLRFAIAMFNVDPRTGSDFREKTKQCLVNFAWSFSLALSPQNVIEVTDGQSLSVPMISAIASVIAMASLAMPATTQAVSFGKCWVFQLKAGLGCQRLTWEVLIWDSAFPDFQRVRRHNFTNQGATSQAKMFDRFAATKGQWKCKSSGYHLWSSTGVSETLRSRAHGRRHCAEFVFLRLQLKEIAVIKLS